MKAQKKKKSRKDVTAAPGTLTHSFDKLPLPRYSSSYSQASRHNRRLLHIILHPPSFPLLSVMMYMAIGHPGRGVRRRCDAMTHVGKACRVVDGECQPGIET